MATKFLRLFSQWPSLQRTQMHCATKNSCHWSYRQLHMLILTSHLLEQGPTEPIRKSYQIKFKMDCWKRSLATSLEPELMSPKVTISEMKHFFMCSNLPFEQGHTCFRLVCPFCPGKPIPSKSNTVYINMTTGMFICYSCRRVGTWQVFQDYISMIQLAEKPDESRQNLPVVEEAGIFLTGKVEYEIQERLTDLQPVGELSREDFQRIVKLFNLKRLSASAFNHFNVRVNKERTALVYPYYGPDRKLFGLKYSHVQPAAEETEDFFFPKQIILGLFGWHRVSKNQQEIVLVSNPLDALSVSQETNVPAIALPRGTAALPQEVLPLLEQFRKITIWFGNNISEWQAAKMFARKLGERRCHFVRPKEEHPAPLQGLHSQINLLKVLRESEPITHKAITTFSYLRQDVYAELSHMEQVSGVKWKRYPALNRLLKGHRRGELTVFTGPTGSGKTTFMSEYSLDLCMQGVGTTVGSFEIKNVRLAKMMLTQFAQIPLEKNLEHYEHWADKFEQLPLYFMTFHGQQSMRNVLDAMSHAVYVHDIQHVIVDNVQFMLGTSEDNTRLDRFWRQDLLVACFRKFATQYNCHVTLVMHPRKERETDELSNSSIFGGAKASQEADNILILQDKRLSTLRGRKYIQVTKNRFDGDIGIMPLEFDKETMSFFVRKKQKKTPSGISEERQEDTPA
ncbi:LOW QUALITY PROTEIN: mitochondrial DNA helicase [Tachypleus tridentatus]|uniref:LOW QUALITY PROTEIN: mitochondrial DNA helicase n=1 Tax=Tachypleus tridentatus TaxID=6853 RepID=UPI003FD43C31